MTLKKNGMTYKKVKKTYESELQARSLVESVIYIFEQNYIIY